MPKVMSVGGGHRIYISDGTILRDYQLCFENFDSEVTSITDMETMGWVETDINTATSRAVTVEPENNFLLVDAGTKADSGSSLQLLTDSTATHTNAPHKSIGPMISTATLMDARSMFFFTRVGFAHTVAAWVSKFLIGWCVTDTSLMSPTTGAPSITTGGGIYFHIGEDADISAVTQTAAAAADTTSIGTQGTPTSATVVGDWVELGFLWECTDADAATGTAYFYMNGVLVATKTDGMPMTSTQTYGVSIEASNADTTSQNLDVGVDYIITGISGPGR